MADKDLAQYLNAHLAGSVGALELLEAIQHRALNAPQQEFVRELRAEIEESQATLRALMVQLGIEEHRLELAAAWLGEKFARARLAVTASGHPVLGWLEGLEMLGLGIQGQVALWRALGAVAVKNPALRGFDFGSLTRQAAAQFAAVERERLTAAVTAFSAEP